MIRNLLRAAGPCLLLTFSACGSSKDEPTDATAGQEPRIKSIAGTLTYPEWIPLAPESIVTVQLVDVSKADTSAPVVAETILNKPGKPPVPYVLKYDANKIESGHRYSLKAQVMEQTRLMFMSDAAYPVLENEKQPPVDIELKLVPGGRVERMAENVRANNPALSGFYRYRDGQGQFTDCTDGESHPVAQEQAVYSLESEYRDVAPSFGDEVFVSVAGKYVTRPARSGRGKEDFLVVVQVEEMDADGDCP